MKQELLKGLTEEQIAKIKACKNQEEVLKLAKEEGVELTDEQLEAVSGGSCDTPCWFVASANTIWSRCSNMAPENMKAISSLNAIAATIAGGRSFNHP